MFLLCMLALSHIHVHLYVYVQLFFSIYFSKLHYSFQKRRKTPHDQFILFCHVFKVYLAMEAGYLEKVDELCERYSLEGFLNAKSTH